MYSAVHIICPLIHLLHASCSSHYTCLGPLMQFTLLILIHSLHASCSSYCFYWSIHFMLRAVSYLYWSIHIMYRIVHFTCLDPFTSCIVQFTLIVLIHILHVSCCSHYFSWSIHFMWCSSHYFSWYIYFMHHAVHTTYLDPFTSCFVQFILFLLIHSLHASRSFILILIYSHRECIVYSSLYLSWSIHFIYRAVHIISLDPFTSCIVQFTVFLLIHLLHVSCSSH